MEAYKDDVILDGFVDIVELARRDPRVAFLLCKSFVRSMEKLAGDRPLMDPTRSEEGARKIDQVADAFRSALPGIEIVDPPLSTKS